MSKLAARRIVDPVATELVHGFSQANTAAPFIAPVVTVKQRAGQVVTFGKESFALRNTLRSPGDRFERERVQYSSQPYYIHQHARGAEVAVEDYEEADEVASINLRSEAINQVNLRIAQSWENEVITGITNIADYEPTNTFDLTALPWSNTSSDPEADVLAAREAIRSQIGRYPTRAVISPDVFNALKLHPKFQDRIKYTSTGVVTEDLLAQYFGLVGGIRVVEGVYYDEATDNLIDFMNGQMVMFYSPEDAGGSSFAKMNGGGIFTNVNSNTKAKPSAWYTYALSGYPVAFNERLDEDRYVYVSDIIFEQRFVITNLGATDKVGAAALLYNLV